MSNLLHLSQTPDQELDQNNTADASLALAGASWFFWIAALSGINSVLFATGADVSFLAGLAFNLLVESLAQAAVAEGFPDAVRWAGFAFSLIAVVGFALIGYFARRLVAPVYLLGIVLYTLDLLLIVLIGDWLMTAFHCFALFFLIRGYLATRRLNRAQGDGSTMMPPPASTFGQN